MAVGKRLALARDPKILLNWMMEGVGRIESMRVKESTASSSDWGCSVENEGKGNRRAEGGRELRESFEIRRGNLNLKGEEEKHENILAIKRSIVEECFEDAKTNTYVKGSARNEPNSEITKLPLLGGPLGDHEVDGGAWMLKERWSRVWYILSVGVQWNGPSVSYRTRTGRPYNRPNELIGYRDMHASRAFV
ncbi:hypothetical protein PIB30_042214 [Stylosanthes scabra]|uniref:Uncharacterized protein n=1 Tax=Stylosanthes scabra TaxID=79078 RepID=A0ABU6WD85_9FABA|nr:hypothetical protein [Stylosanthes scabra]